METKNFQLDAIKEKFPDHAELIAKLYYRDDAFRALCEDYYTCIYYLTKFQKEFSERIESFQEFENAKVELEKELTKYLR